MKRFQQFAKSPTLVEESLQLFTLIALNCSIRNGNAHLKNFGILYDEVEGEAHAAPVYDLVTTGVYLPQDRMALMLNGTNQWPSAKDLMRFGEGRSLGTRRTLVQTFERISDALSATIHDVLEYSKEHPEFAPIGRQMLEQWEVGRRQSLAVPDR
jgi:serine/threonine-protein kinase HipA